ncbi:flagellar motor protein [Paenibacillus sp. ACRRX]|uniref:flagellar motor protein n=1 Tax=unclassified Paenibacillus TaxID=185978 RepID=UPI001EF70A62|nr:MULTISPECIES: flagellar motor protein [unclassified Paenibacillus]MCG7407958.1 flagellar motor protein [Paenibacillus sp. ACRRX]MDK8181661.1 flagellar motor protein [Paenibacillus sp. UMB4589-SE434]
MDKTTLIGIIAGLVALIGGFLLEGGNLSGLWEATAALIVFGGTFAAVVVSFPGNRLRSIPQALKLAFRQTPTQMPRLIDDIVAMGTQARRDGVLALEDMVQKHKNPFLRDGMMMVVDGTDPELIKQILDIDMDAVEHKHDGYAKIFEAAGGYAPTMGIIGTVMGLIHVLSNLNDPTMLGPSIAVAFTATLYGVATANVIYLPIASKIKTRSEQMIREMEMLQFGVLAVQAGENPQIIRKKLSSFMQGEDAIQPLQRVPEMKRGMTYETQK